MQITCVFERAITLLNVNPSISKKEFDSLGFTQYHHRRNNREGGTWSVYYRRDINSKKHFDELDIKWFCGTERYEITRNTKSLINMTVFSGYLRSKADLELILSLADLTAFYESSEELDIRL